MPRSRSTFLFVFVALFAFWGTSRQTSTQSSTEAEYGVTDLGTLGGPTSAALAIHPIYGEVVGHSQTTSGAVRAFSLNFMEQLSMYELVGLGGANSEAWAVADTGRVGRAQTATGAYHAFFHDADGPFDLGTLGGTHSYATGIATVGGGTTIVGASLLAGDTTTRAFSVALPGGRMTALPATLGGPNTVANAVNGNGHIVGRADLAGGTVYHAFLFADGTTTDLGTLGTNSEAYAINIHGTVVGRSRLTNGNQHAFRYQGGSMQDLGTLGGAESEGHALSSLGVIVGWAQTSAGERHAFVWRDGVMRDLNLLIPSGSGWVLEAATGISENGAIVGYGLHNGQRRAFLLSPPIDLHVGFRYHDPYHDTNIPNPHETGQRMPWGVSILGADYGNPATNVTVNVTISGPVAFVPDSIFLTRPGNCVQEGQSLTCRLPHLEFEGFLFYDVRATAAGVIGHSVTVRADQLDRDPSNNSGSDSNTAVSIASLTLTPTTIVGGKLSGGRVTLTSRCPPGGARVTLASSRPEIASVPSEFDVLPWSGDGLWREFHVTTRPVSAPVTVQISATYGLVTKVVPLTIVPDATQRPYGGTARAIPGIIQAEDFDEGGEGVAYHDTSASNNGGAYRTGEGVDLETTRDTGGGVNVGWIAAGEWLEYSVNVASSGTYTLEARVASPGAGGTFHVEQDGANQTGAITIPNTGGWQNWTTVSRSMSLAGGAHILRIAFDTNGASGAVGNLNHVRLVATAGGSTPYGGTPRHVPGTIEAEDFDDGGEGVAFHDTTTVNSGGQYRNTGVDIEATRDPLGGRYNVGWMAPLEWSIYTVNVATAGTYTLTARVAANGAGGTFHVEFDGVDKTGPLTIPNTGGWQNWTDVAATVTIAAGVQRMRFVADRAGSTGVFGNLNFLKLESASPPPASDIVLYSSDFTRVGTWMLQADATAAGGQKMLTADTGASNTTAPLASPSSYVQATFSAPAATPYTIWLRLRATGDTKYSESVWVQFSDARAAGAGVYPTGSVSGLLVNLENCSGCGVAGWGWQNRAYWLSQPTTVTFGGSGAHTIRIQMREDGAQIDQVVLSPSRYLTSAPGALKNDATIVSK